MLESSPAWLPPLREHCHPSDTLSPRTPLCCSSPRETAHGDEDRERGARKGPQPVLTQWRPVLVSIQPAGPQHDGCGLRVPPGRRRVEPLPSGSCSDLGGSVLFLWRKRSEEGKVCSYHGGRLRSLSQAFRVTLQGASGHRSWAPEDQQ